MRHLRLLRLAGWLGFVTVAIGCAGAYAGTQEPAGSGGSMMILVGLGGALGGQLLNLIASRISAKLNANDLAERTLVELRSEFLSYKTHAAEDSKRLDDRLSKMEGKIDGFLADLTAQKLNCASKCMTPHA